MGQRERPGTIQRDRAHCNLRVGLPNDGWMSPPSQEFTAIGASQMEIPDGKQKQPDADLSEAMIWYMRSKAKRLAAAEMREFESWLHRAPENASALLTIAEREHHATSHRRSTSRLNRARVRIERLNRVASQASTKLGAISQDYLRHLKKRYFWPKLGLLTATACSAAGWLIYQDTRLLKIGTVAFVCFLLLTIREAVVGFRIANGYFGTTESEVRDFISFVGAHRNDIDFTDDLPADRSHEGRDEEKKEGADSPRPRLIAGAGLKAGESGAR